MIDAVPVSPIIPIKSPGSKSPPCPFGQRATGSICPYGRDICIQQYTRFIHVVQCILLNLRMYMNVTNLLRQHMRHRNTLGKCLGCSVDQQRSPFRIETLTMAIAPFASVHRNIVSRVASTGATGFSLFLHMFPRSGICNRSGSLGRTPLFELRKCVCHP